MKGFQGQRGGPKHTGPSWSVSRGIGRENNGVWGDSGVTVSGVLDFKKQREMEKNERWIIWDEKYNELGMQWGFVRPSTWVPEVLKIWGQSGI